MPSMFYLLLTVFSKILLLKSHVFPFYSADIDPRLELETVVNSVQNKHAAISAKKLLKKNKKLQESEDKK